ncbi:MAG: type I DNA topoisomerase [Pseudomonadota bacterium]|jgi:DNA topoisomerase-1
MSKNLVIVESPAKAKTIKKYLGKDFEVVASVGHIRDLVSKDGAVDPENDFRMNYAVTERGEKQVDAIVKAMKRADTLYLATDPDREGEAISWHILEVLRERGVLGTKPVHRAKFFEITKKEIQTAIAHPESLSTALVNAQQARRALDHLIGFKLSPLLWKKMFPGLSAGRVQSVALRLICEREAEIQAFNRLEYWTIEVDAEKTGQSFKARVVEVNGRRIEADVAKSAFTLTNETSARAAEQALAAACRGELVVAEVEAKPRQRSPQAPFRTSTLQQAGANRLGYSARRTMQLAQKLYEGVDFGEGPVGLITYMRTDSTSLSVDAIGEIRQTIASAYGADAVPAQPRSYANKQKNAQEAHEAIRPTSAANTPDQLKGKIDEDMWRLYDLIWKRSVASQMVNAIFEQVTVTLKPGADPTGGVVRANGSTLVKAGFLAAYGVDVNDDEETEEGGRLPALAKGDRTQLLKLSPEQHFTQPPPRYTEATLVRALEERGIGRPSTYASIIETLRARKYVDDERRNFLPTDTGKVVSRFLVEYFATYVDYDFTARLEDSLDDISRGDKEWIPVLREFWGPFIKQVRIAEDIPRPDFGRQLGIDTVSGRPVSIRVGQYGPFAQIGTREDVEKPKFASLKPGQSMDTISLAESLDLFLLPRVLGELPDGGAVSVAIGRFGPFVKYGASYVSLKAPDDPYTIEFPRALEVIAEKKATDAARLIRDHGDGIQVLNGRFGPYITDGEKNAKIPKDREPASLSREECAVLIEAAPVPKGRGRFGRKKTAAKKSTKPAKAPAKKKAAKTKAAAKKA